MLVYLALIDGVKEKLRFGQLYYKYEKLMFYIAKRILNNEKDAEEAVQEAFLSIAKKFSKISSLDANKTRAYFVTVVERKAIDIYRANKKHDSAELEEAWLGDEPEYSGLSPLAVAISKLPREQRELIMLKYDCGFTSKEIAKMLDTSDGAVRQRLLKAKENLRKELEKEGVEV